MQNKDSFINEFQEKIKTKDLTGVIEGLNLLIDIRPDNNRCVNLYKYRACLKIQLGDYFSGLKDLNKVLTLNPDDTETDELRVNLIMLLENLECKSI